MISKEEMNLSVGIPLDRFIQLKQADFPFASGELSQLLRDIALAGKMVNLGIARSGLNGMQGNFGKTNIQGEAQQKLDVMANERFISALQAGGEVCAIMSEEEDEVIDLSKNKAGKYVIAIDPLDGSSNIDVNVSVGTIFSIYRRKSPIGAPLTEEDVLQKGDEQVAAGYLIYGSSCMLVYTTGRGVNGFTYEPSVGEFFLSHKNMIEPQQGKYFSVNEGAYYTFEEGVQRYIDYCKKEAYSGRYIGSLVADFHRNLLKGGIYMYPKSMQSPRGKLRLCYECNALAFLVEQAGGMASDGKKRIMELKPKTLHERTPFFVGSKEMVIEVLSEINRDGK